MRIYQLAKELQRDSKELVEICKKIGLAQKGSALASLTDDEVQQVKAYLERGKAPTPAPVAVASPTAEPVTKQPGAEKPAPIPRPDDLIPALVKPSGKIKVLGAKSKKSSGEQKPATDEVKKEPPKPRTPVIHVARLPDVQTPVPPPPPEEPPVQKPELRLPVDAIRSARAGSRAPIEELAEKVRQRERSKEKTKEREKEFREVATETVKEIAKKPPKGRGKRDFDVDELDGAMADMISARADRQKRRLRQLETRELEEDIEETQPVVRRRLQRRRGTSTAAPRKSKIVVELPCTVRTFSEATGVSSSRVLATAMKLGQLLNINATLDQELVELLAVELGLDIELKQPELPEERILRQMREEQDDPALLVPRPPVVTFLGHVDHGKTSMLDYLIGTNVASREAGGITQHIRAYQVQTKEGRRVTFVDTPGHEAFTELRARGAKVTDIAVIVIAADDGIMPQTEEAISHARAAGVPIVVAINKIDLQGTHPERILMQLTEHNLTPSQWGGDIEVVQTSAVTGQGMDTLLETLLTLADLHDYRANPTRRAYGVCLEAEQAGSRGVIAKLIVRNGTLRVGDIVVCGSAYGRVKAMFDPLHTDRRMDEAPPSCPVNMIGFDEPPSAGQVFFVVDDVQLAREIAERRREQERSLALAGSTARVSFDRFQQMLQEGPLAVGQQTATLNLIIRADTRGSIDAILKELEKLQHPEVTIRVLHKGVGGVTVGDVHLAEASDAVIIGFNVTADEKARELAEQKQIEIRQYDIIYQLTDDLKAVLEGRLKPEQQIIDLGRAVVKQVFTISRVGNVAGCYVVHGKLERGCRVRVFRDGRKIGDYVLESLRREKDDVREVTRGFECGVKLGNFEDIKQEDILEAYKIEEVARKL